MTINSLRSRRSKRAGFTLIEIMTVIVIIGIMVALALPSLKKLFGDAEQTQAVQLQGHLQNWYEGWTTSGGRHNAAGGTPADMAKMLMDLCNSDPLDAGTPKAAGAMWVNEQRQMLNGQSQAGHVRWKLTKPYALSGAVVLYDSKYEVVFNTNNTNDSGTFVVTVAAN